MFLVGLNGDSGPSRTVSRLLNESMKAARTECRYQSIFCESEIIDLPVVANFCDGLGKRPPREIFECLNIIRKADALIFATPVYWFGPSATMKAFLDWLTWLEAKNFALEGKVAGVIAHCREDGGNQATMALIGPLLHMGMMIPPYCAFFRNRHVASRSEGQWQLKEHRLVGRNVVRLANQIRSVKSWGDSHR
jgi:multimeric flavodoxin WrbA